MSSMTSMTMSMASSATGTMSDMAMSTMSMASSATATMSDMAMSTMSMAASATSSSSSSMSGMSGMSSSSSSSSSCSISMLWNWNTIDSCFLARSWHVTSHGMFAGGCIGILCLAMAVEFVRRAQREYERKIVQDFNAKRAQEGIPVQCPNSENCPSGSGSETSPIEKSNMSNIKTGFPALFSRRSGSGFRPTALQQLIRALFYLFQFAGAYFIMLTAMYYNGYMIICIFLGAFIGYFLFASDSIGGGEGDSGLICC